MSAAVLVGCAEVRVAMPIAHLVAVEVFDAAVVPVFGRPVLSTIRIAASESVMAIEPIINVSPEVIPTVIPRACADEYSVQKPLRPVVAVGCAFIGWIVEVTVGANGRWSDLHRNLRMCALRQSRKTESGKCGHHQES